MANSKKIVWIVLILLAVVIKTLSFFPGAVEKYYAMGIYPPVARLQRLLFGWIPFSIGDILYLAAILWLLYGIFAFIRALIRRKAGRAFLLGCLRRTVLTVLWVYVVFNLCWGLNYDRTGIADQLGLEVRPYSTDELAGLVRIVAGRLNELDSAGRADRAALDSKKMLFRGAVESYGRLAAGDPRFAYPPASVKSSIYSYPEAYLGFGGYYNPFTGEAQVNSTLPVFVRPYTTCHEMGHQLGYARENEANFAGYLAARSSADPAFRYSVYFDMYLYAARELYMRDSNLVKPVRESLKPAVRKDFRELQQYNRRYSSPIEPVMMRLYGSYLKANRQPQGIRTYNEVVAWLIAYGRKYGPGAI